jgi:hypothetical protein
MRHLGEGIFLPEKTFLVTWAEFSVKNVPGVDNKRAKPRKKRLTFWQLTLGF